MSSPAAESVKVTSSCKRWKFLGLVATTLLGISVFLHARSWRTWDEVTPSLRLMDKEDEEGEGPFRDYYAPGITMAFIGTTDVVPEGWLLCDGKRLNTADYPRLYDEIGQYFSVEANPEGTFRLPDYRGMFVGLMGDVHWNANLGDPTKLGARNYFETRAKSEVRPEKVEGNVPEEFLRCVQIRWLVRAR